MSLQSTTTSAGHRRRRVGALAVVAALFATACTSTAGPATTVRPRVPVPTYVDASGFNDHTVPVLRTVDEFFALARQGASGQWAVKFTISDMADDPSIAWMDSNFYSLHDEWYWFRLLNGAAVSGVDVAPIVDRRFDTVAQVYDWAIAQRAPLPLDLAFVGGRANGNRLYSDGFYDLSLNDPRAFGLGTVAYFSPVGGGDGRWVLELEYQDVPEPAEIGLFFDMIAASVPAEIGSNLKWVVRSPGQATVAATMAAGGLPFHDRTVTYAELVEPGSVAVYNEGIAAGRLLLIGEGGKDLTDAGDNDILLVENVPDFLPPGRALISSAPQTPLAHVNLLARNRGIPNASQAGILQDPAIQQAARVRAHAIVRASVADGLEVVLITEEEYGEWLKLTNLSPVAVPGTAPGSDKNVLALAQILVSDESDIARWRPLIGGKAAGFLTLRVPGSIEVPEPQLVITTVPYFAHLEGVAAHLDAMLANPELQRSTRVRFLLLEGPSAFAERYPDPTDRAFAEGFVRSHPAGTPIGDIVAAGGFGELLRAQPMAADALADITGALESHFGELHPSQGLRFRSSSSVEDIEGFNGAGLYDSNTGFLRPDIQLDDKDRKKSVEWAVKATWASYWGFEAFEERRAARVDHRSGGMAILVHPRFDDPHELANGVLTFTIMPKAAEHEYSMVLNVQQGAVSVTNPEPGLGALPEVIVARSDGGDSVEVELASESNLVAPGTRVLADAQVAELFGQALAVTRLWRQRLNAALPPAQRVGTLTLDFEFKEMAAGWPQYRDGDSGPDRPARLVFKQARSLEPGLRQVPPAVRDLPIPRDVLARARLVERLRCAVDTDGGTSLTSSVVEVWTDPLLLPDVGFSTVPFVVVEAAGASLGSRGEECTRTVLYSTPDQFLYELLEGGELLNLSR